MMNGWKTALLALLVSIFGAVQVFVESLQLPAETLRWVTAGLGVVIFALRAVTNTPIFNKVK